jgi:hypothetical protein
MNGQSGSDRPSALAIRPSALSLRRRPGSEFRSTAFLLALWRLKRWPRLSPARTRTVVPGKNNGERGRECQLRGPQHFQVQRLLHPLRRAKRASGAYTTKPDLI